LLKNADKNEVYAFGSNGNGQLGIDKNETRQTPVPTCIPALKGKDVGDIGCGSYFAFALTNLA
jgi:alpha-tubulin suppressor-like RCC1 family protein